MSEDKLSSEQFRKFSLTDIILTTIFTMTFIVQIILMFFTNKVVNFIILEYFAWIIWILSIYFALIPFILFKKRGDVEKGKSYINTTKIVKNGAYAIIRHPQYLGGILFSVSITLWNPVWFNLVFTLIIIILTYQWTYTEDKRLVEKFGEEYKKYIKSVPRLNPILGIIKFFSRKKNEKFP